MARIEGVWIAPDKAVPIQSTDEVEAIAGTGLIGDRYFLGTGAWSDTRNVVRHVSLIELETIEAVCSNGLPLTAALTRRNLVTSGISLNHCVNRRFQIGGERGPILRGVELCDPCQRPGKLSDDPALKRNLERALNGRGGLRAEVLESGLITIHATIIMLDD